MMSSLSVTTNVLVTLKLFACNLRTESQNMDWLQIVCVCVCVCTCTCVLCVLCMFLLYMHVRSRFHFENSTSFATRWKIALNSVEAAGRPTERHKCYICKACLRHTHTYKHTRTKKPTNDEWGEKMSKTPKAPICNIKACTQTHTHTESQYTQKRTNKNKNGQTIFSWTACHSQFKNEASNLKNKGSVLTGIDTGCIVVVVVVVVVVSVGSQLVALWMSVGVGSVLKWVLVLRSCGCCAGCCECCPGCCSVLKWVLVLRSCGCCAGCCDSVVLDVAVFWSGCWCSVPVGVVLGVATVLSRMLVRVAVGVDGTVKVLV